MSKLIKLDALGEEFLFPDEFVLHNEGYLSFKTFIDRVYMSQFGRPTTLREEVGYSLATFSAAYADYGKMEEGVLKKHAHIFVSQDIRPFPLLSLYSFGHEETHVVAGNAIFGRDSIKERLSHLGIDSRSISDNDETFACIGGLSCFIPLGIPVGVDSDSRWQEFVSQGSKFKMYENPGFSDAVEWMVKNKK